MQAHTHNGVTPCRMGTTHAAAVKAEIAKVASGLNRTAGANGQNPEGLGRNGNGADSWLSNGRGPVNQAPTSMSVNLADLVVTKGYALRTLPVHPARY